MIMFRRSYFQHMHKKKAHYTGFLLRLQLKIFSFTGVNIVWWA